MRKTNMSVPITRTEVKPGDKIRVVREVTVKTARPAKLSGGVDATIVTTDVPEGAVGETLALTPKETVILLERDIKVEIPKSAVVIYWQDRDGDDVYARYDADRQAWVDSDGDEYESTEKLAQYIERYIEEGTFEVLKRRPLFSEGGLVQGYAVPGRSYHGLGFDPGTMSALARNVLPRNVVA